jgi:hypothetical protein
VFADGVGGFGNPAAAVGFVGALEAPVLPGLAAVFGVADEGLFIP